MTRALIRKLGQDDPVNMSDEVATRLGLKAYSHGTTYNGGNAPTITLTAGGGTLDSVPLGKFYPYQDQDGTWRCKFNIQSNCSSLAARTGITLAINGLSFHASASQAIEGWSGANGATVSFCNAVAGGNTLNIVYTSATTSTHRFSGDVELASKPTWAY